MEETWGQWVRVNGEYENLKRFVVGLEQQCAEKERTIAAYRVELTKSKDTVAHMVDEQKALQDRYTHERLVNMTLTTERNLAQDKVRMLTQRVEDITKAYNHERDVSVRVVRERNAAYETIRTAIGSARADELRIAKEKERAEFWRQEAIALTERADKLKKELANMKKFSANCLDAAVACGHDATRQKSRADELAKRVQEKEKELKDFKSQSRLYLGYYWTVNDCIYP